MNCHEFKAKWTNTVDDDIALSHLETCDECLAWLENEWSSSEENLFLKEIPQPSIDLENSIMNKIYASPQHHGSSSQSEKTEPGIIPLAATDQAKVSSKPKAKRFRFLSYPVLGAASVLLVMGLVGVQALNGGFTGNNTEQIQPPQVAYAPTPEGSTSYMAQSPQIDTKQAPIGGGSPETNAQVSDPKATSQEKLLEAPAPSLKKAEGTTEKKDIKQAKSDKDTAVAQAKKSQAPSANSAIAMHDNSKQAVQQDQNNKPASSSLLASRSLSPMQTASKEHAVTASSATEKKADQNSGSESTLSSDQLEKLNDMAIAGPENQGGVTSPNNSLTATETPSVDENKVESVGGATSEMFTQEAEKEKEKPQTFSSFTSLEKAKQSSDMPLAALVKADYKLASVAIHYESETSKHVTSQTSVYHHGDAQIKLEVLRNDTQKRTLSIPGTFAGSPQIFYVGTDKAIGVTFDSQEKNTMQHAVHLITTKSSQPLYVIATAKGMSLQDLMDIVKTMNWS
ncbi:hypothetical protein O0555_22420 [Brevibacillus laterosporus]|uniref:hypothetical protein n=1 Tax=Brevibacillus laterosporus TaxID=1465 RepID=UPI0018CE88AC|nr:hypothetical protein [Brevibacillus laterosporus]MBG9797825.1 hypothetical protein [Brevibacillus laterosporus]MCR8940042.1 hypothetical protein [Brevibacillus laterosporus]MCZ0842682.1 hypothetical protein [Brevibacillus laterosporus]MCZ0846597.1 hypothetical protein [Brevibacillus laterosporus]MED1913384.1 hypothetical protein [Brevibacillus laterosporus]